MVFGATLTILQINFFRKFLGHVLMEQNQLKLFQEVYCKKIFLTDVCNLLFTSIRPFLSFLIPTLVKFKPSVYGLRPTETNTLSTSMISFFPYLFGDTKFYDIDQQFIFV